MDKSHRSCRIQEMSRSTSHTHLLRLFFIALIMIPFGTSCSLTSQYVNERTPVYMNGGDAKYHTADCRYVDDSSIKVTLSYAVSQGLEPCLVCSPPVLKERESNLGRSFLLFLIGGIVAAFVVLGIPTIIQDIIVRNSATEIAKSRSGDEWETLSRREQKRRIKEVEGKIETPPPRRPPDEEE